VPLLDGARKVSLAFSSVVHAILSLVLAALAVRVPFLGSVAQLSCFGASRAPPLSLSATTLRRR